MYKNIILSSLIVVFFSACISPNLLKFGELDNDVANQDKIINNFDGETLIVDVTSDIETLSVVVPKDNMTVIVKLAVANIEDVLYMNIVDSSKFKINKLIRRVSSLEELEKNQDGWVFEPSVEKGIVTLQLYLPELYLYTSKYSPKLLFSFKRSSRSVQDSIQFHFIRQNYYTIHNDDGYEMPQYGTLSEYCVETENGLSETFTTQIEQLNENRVDEEFKVELMELGQ